MTDFLQAFEDFRKDAKDSYSAKVQAIAKGIHSKIVDDEPAITGTLLSNIVIHPETTDPVDLYRESPSGKPQLGFPSDLPKPDEATLAAWRDEARRVAKERAEAIKWGSEGFCVTAIVPYAPEVEHTSSRFNGLSTSGLGPSLAFQAGAQWARNNGEKR